MLAKPQRSDLRFALRKPVGVARRPPRTRSVYMFVFTTNRLDGLWVFFFFFFLGCCGNTCLYIPQRLPAAKLKEGKNTHTHCGENRPYGHKSHT